MQKTVWKKIVLVLMTIVVLALGGVNVSAASTAGISIKQGKVYQNDKIYTGWYTQNNSKYYSVNGTRAKGWKKISNKYYYFASNCKLVTNRIVGSKAKGYFYVDKTGARITTKEIRQAVDFVMKNSKASDKPAVRMKACFKALLKYPYHHMSAVAPKASQIPSCAGYMFSNKKGNCYRYASSMAYIARVLGYDVRVACGGVTARGAGAALSPHGWCEVKYGNAWRMIDCSMQRAYTSKNLYLVTRKQYPFRLRCDKVYTMTSSNGGIKWS